MTQTWQEIVADKHVRQKAAIPQEWIVTLPEDSAGNLNVVAFPRNAGLLSAKEQTITESTVDVLLLQLASGELSSVEVTTAFYKRAIIAHQLTNCLTEIFVKPALARAAELDEYLKNTGHVVGPLHGLPVSLKDQICIKDIEASMGYVSWLGEYSKEDSVLVHVLKKAGAVPFVKTNVPQTLMWPETYNLVFGRTTNPYNRSLTCGGSSGGEGALIALKGSPLGVGSDIGGSVRIPSGFCGTYGLRPSYGRVPYAKSVNSAEGQDSVPSVLGPLSNDLGGIKAFLKAVAGEKPWLKDPLAVRKPWNEDEYQLAEHGHGKSLVFGILWDDGLVVPHPPIIRGLELTKKALIAAGHTVVDWVPHKHGEIYDVMNALYCADSGEDFRTVAALTGEPVLASMATYPSEATSKSWLQTKSPGPLTAYQLWQVQKKKRDLRQEYLDRWEATAATTSTGRPVDAIIAPVAPYAAPPHSKNINANYTLVYNALDYPALVVPVCLVDQAVDKKKPAHKFLSNADEANYNTYDPATFVNAPVSIQVVGRTLEEEAVIGISEIVDAALKNLLAEAPNDSKPLSLQSKL